MMSSTSIAVTNELGLRDAPSGQLPPRRPEGLELIGEYEGSGLKDPPFLVRRADGQVIQLTRLLFEIASSADGRRESAEIARFVGQRYGRELDARDVELLVSEKLVPAGVLDFGTSPGPLRRSVPMLGLRFRARVLPARAVGALTWLFYPLFFAPVAIAATLAFLALDVWLFFIHGTAQPLRHVIYDPAFLLLVFGLTVVSALFHECGHATACRFSGGRPGAMGVGIYLVWPAFFTDVTDAYRLNRRGRLRTDLGGVYFNAIFSLATATAFFATGFEALLVVVVLQHVQMLYQFLPFLRLDGYYLVADLTGVPDLFARIGPTLQSLVPWKRDPRAHELKPWVRAVVTAWVISTLGFLSYMVGAIVLSLPRIVATVASSLSLRYDALRGSVGAGDLTAATADTLQVGALVLPTVGAILMLGRIGARSAAGLWRWAQVSVPHALFAGGLLAIAVAIVLSTGTAIEFAPISPDERWTADVPVRIVTGGSSVNDAALVGSTDIEDANPVVTNADDFSRDGWAVVAGSTVTSEVENDTDGSSDPGAYEVEPGATEPSATPSGSPSGSPTPSGSSSGSPTPSASPSQSP